MSADSAGVVIIGAGQAGYQTAESLRQSGYSGPITILGAEQHTPYQRPPLSKAYLLGDTDRERLQFRTAEYYAEHAIALRCGVRVESIDRAAKTVQLDNGEQLAYAKLVLTTGARVRKLPLPGADADGVCYLQTLEDVDDIEARLANVESVAVVGAGFIGLEFAAVARKLGKKVTVFEAAERVMSRVVTPELSAFYEAKHREHGVEMVCSAQVVGFAVEDGALCGIDCADGSRVDVQMAVVGIGVIANSELAEAAGLPVERGVIVDGHCRTTDADIFAAGDCASFVHPYAGELIRLESVQNAADQGRVVAANILADLGEGELREYDTVPWFWSDQYDLKLQMVGLQAGCDQTVRRGDPADGKFSLFHFRGDELRAVDSVNKPADHVVSRKLLAAGVSPTPEQAADDGFKLKDLLKG